MFGITAPTLFYFVRHGQTEYNRREIRCGGDLDIPLTEIGARQAGRVAGQLQTAGAAIGLIVTSPLQRTHRTAEIISAALGGLEIVLVPGFIERRLGDWNGRPIKDTEPLLRAGRTPPGGESEAEFHARIETTLDSLRPLLDRRPLVVASKGVARVLGEILGIEERLDAANAQIIEFDCRPPGEITIRRLA
jgi:probable phosphoglycerate mutase